jgi:hypothetical protein
MKKLLKISMGLLLALLLSVSAPIISLPAVPSTVYAATVQTPKVKESSVTLYVGYKTYQIKFTNLSSSASLSFKSSNKKVAQVNKTGIITPIKKGSATVTATIEQKGKKYTSQVKVTVDNPNIKFTAKTKSLKVGESFTFKAKAYGSSDKIVWSVSKTSLATIDSSGKLTAKKAGEVEVIATSGNISVTYTVTIDKGIFSTDSTNLALYDQQLIYINAEKMDNNDSIIYNVDNEDIVTCKWGTWNGKAFPLLITPQKKGSTVITITSVKSTEKLIINVTVVDEPSGRDANAKELTAKEIYTKCAPSTVEIQTEETVGGSLGSGFFIQSGVVVTNYHVIEDATKIKVITYDNKEYEVESILGYNKDYDIAILYIDAVTEHLALNKGDISVGETVYALGSPQGLTGSLSEGIVSSASRVYDGVEYIQVTAPISSGNSGGPLVNEYGEVIGINTFYFTDSQNLNFALNVFQVNKIDINSPINPSDFYAQNEAKSLNEDPAKSQKASTAQIIDSNTIVMGSLSYANDIDVYHIKLTSSDYVLGICAPDESSYFNDLYFSVLDSQGYIVLDSSSYTFTDGSPYLGFEDTLSAGDYYIVVYAGSDYLNYTLNYSFYIKY